MSKPLPDFDAAKYRICRGPCGQLQVIYNFFDINTGTINDVCFHCLTTARTTVHGPGDVDHLTSDQIFDRGTKFWQIAVRAAHFVGRN